MMNASPTAEVVDAQLTPPTLSPQPPAVDASQPRRKITKFLLEDDLALLTEVVAAEDAFSRPCSHQLWAGIVSNLVLLRPRLQGLTARACKERAERLVKQHKADDNWRARQ